MKKECFEILNQTFDKIYVLTIGQATYRQDHIKSELEGLNYEFYFGKDKNTIDNSVIDNKEIYDKEKTLIYSVPQRPIKKGHIACSMSHKRIYKDIIDNNYNKALILEDDVVFLETMHPTIFKNAFSQLPSNWELVYLGYRKREYYNVGVKVINLGNFISKIFNLKGWGKYSNNWITKRYARRYSQNLLISGCHDGTEAYAINLEAAKKLYRMQSPIQFKADNLLNYIICNEGNLNAFCITPKVFMPGANIDSRLNSLINS